MAANPQQSWWESRWRLIYWSLTAVILLAPLVAMQVSDEVQWGLGDFAMAALLLVGAGSVFELTMQLTGNWSYRAAVALALGATLLLIWGNLAVGIIGDAGEAANLMYFAVPLVAILGAVWARFQASRMARAMFAAAGVQALITLVAIAAGFGTATHSWPLDILALTAFFGGLYGASGWFFLHAAQRPPALDTP